MKTDSPQSKALQQNYPIKNSWMTAPFLAIATVMITSACSINITPTFSNTTTAAGLSFTHSSPPMEGTGSMATLFSPGVAIGDVNRDGFLDVFVLGGAGQNAALFINQRDGTFQDHTSAWLIDLTQEDGLAVGMADVDGNGYLDIIAGASPLATQTAMHQLLTNNGQDQYAKQPLAIQSVAGNALGSGYGFGDFELDGDLDLVAASWNDSAGMESQAYTNDGAGQLTEQTAALNFQFSETWGFTPLLADMDGDRYPELLMVADFGTSQYYRNDTPNTGSSSFSLLDNGTGTDENGMGSAVGDIDNDGDLDWFVTSIYDPESLGGWGRTGNRVYQNDGDHNFTDITDTAGVRDGGWGWGASFGDFNVDGLIDLAMTNGFQPPFSANPGAFKFAHDSSRLWINKGAKNPRFRDVSPMAGITDTDLGKGLVSFDADNDGDLDILITNNRGELIFYQNHINPKSNRWLQVELLAPIGNAPDGIGAKVEIAIGNTTYTKHMLSRASFASQEPLRLHFGFAKTNLIDSVTVSWPDGTQKILTNIEPGQILRVNAGDLNADDQVNLEDISLLTTALFSSPPLLTSSEFSRADMDQNGIVDANDLSAIVQRYTQQ